MPKKLNGKKLSQKEHKIWKAVKSKTGSGGAATNAVKRSRRKK